MTTLKTVVNTYFDIQVSNFQKDLCFVTFQLGDFAFECVVDESTWTTFYNDIQDVLTGKTIFKRTLFKKEDITISFTAFFDGRSENTFLTLGCNEIPYFNPSSGTLVTLNQIIVDETEVLYERPKHTVM